MPSRLKLGLEVVLLGLVFAVLCWPLIFSDRESNYSQDESSYHLPAVRQIAAHWPALDVRSDSLSATAPGYHYTLATVSLVTGTGTRTLRLINWSVSALVLVVLYLHLRKSLPPTDAYLPLLPLLFSNFFIKSASWLVTDNAALLLVTLALLSQLRPTTPPAWLGSLTNATAVFVRQTSIWLVVLPATEFIASPNANHSRTVLRTLAIAIAPVGVLLFLISQWHGFVPPVWRDTAIHFSTAGPLYLLAVFGLFTLPYFTPGLWKPELSTKPKATSLAIAILGTIILWLATPSTSNYAQGRWGGYLWNLADHLPAVQQRSLLFLVLAIIGAWAIHKIWSSLHTKNLHRESSLFFLTIIAWGSTFLVNRQVFQRYFEPTILVLLIALTPSLLSGIRPTRRYRLGMWICGGAQLAITIGTVYRAIAG
ncbi:MAG: hypothetical protein IPP19_04695 [Verrucomicrobia bacterium]|nr:hypothetical protein [Verrucomicrobiota bacterium]